MITSAHILLSNELIQAACRGDTKGADLLLRRCKTSELWILQTIDPILLGELLPTVRKEIARRIVQEIIADQPSMEI